MKKLVITAALLAAFSTAALAVDNANSNSISATNTTTDNSGNVTTTNSTTTTSTTKPADSTKKAISVSNLLQQLSKVGYVVKEVDYDKDNQKFKVTAVDRHGDSQTLDLDATVGLTPDQRKVPHDLSLAQAAKKLEKNGSYIKTIQYDSPNYTATVVDKAGNDQSVTIDPKTGKVSNS